MRIYFLSSRPCALKVGGAFFGKIDDFERFADIQLSDHLFLEFIPENGLPLSFFLTEQIRFTPPDGCEVYVLENAIALYARDFPPTDPSLRPIVQIAEGDCLATVFTQGRVHLVIQTEKNFFTSYLPPSFCDCTLFFACNLLFLKSPSQLAVYTKLGEQVFLEKVLSHEIEGDVLRVRLPLSESLGRVADCSYSLTERGCQRTSYVLSQARSEQIDDLLPLAFFESILIGADYGEYLSEELLPEKEKIKGFLGEFLSVHPLPDGRFLLVKKRGERLFEGEYYSVTCKDNKITDITT